MGRVTAEVVVQRGIVIIRAERMASHSNERARGGPRMLRGKDGWLVFFTYVRDTLPEQYAQFIINISCTVLKCAAQFASHFGLFPVSYSGDQAIYILY